MSAEWEEQPPVPAPETTPTATTPGALLAAQREALGWTVEQVAEQLKLARRQVIALEAGDYAALPGSAVVRGFIRAYAKVVRLDAAPLVAMVPLDPPESPNDATAVRHEKPASFSEVRFPTAGARTIPLGPIAGGLLVVALVAAAFRFGLIPSRLSAPAASAPAAAEQQASAPVAETAPAAPPIETTLLKPDQELRNVQKAEPLVSAPVAPAPAANPPAATVPTPAVASNGAGSPAAAAPAAPATTAAGNPANKPAPTAAAPGAAPAATPAAAAPAAPTAAAPGPNALIFNVRGESWLSVSRVSDGKSLLSRLAKPGSTEVVNVSEPVNIIVGKPDEVDATLRGTALVLKPVPSGTTARLSVK